MENDFCNRIGQQRTSASFSRVDCSPGPRRGLLFRCDVYSLESLRIDSLLHHAGLLCFPDKCCEFSQRRGGAAFRQCSGHPNHCKSPRHDLGARQCLGCRVANAEVGTKGVRVAGTQSSAASLAMVGLSGIRTISAALISRVRTRSEGAPRIVPIFTPVLSTEAISGNSFPGAAT